MYAAATSPMDILSGLQQPSMFPERPKRTETDNGDKRQGGDHSRPSSSSSTVSTGQPIQVRNRCKALGEDKEAIQKCDKRQKR